MGSESEAYAQTATAYKFEVQKSDPAYLARPVNERFSLEGKTAIVTGASSGLGIAIARGFAECGARVVIGARRENLLKATSSQIFEATGARPLAVRADVTKVEDCDRLVAAAMAEFGRVDILVNNAGISGELVPSLEDKPDNFRWVVDVNLNGSYWMAQACARVMEPGSSIINISSVVALTTFKTPAAGYAAAKAGVLGLTRDLAAQWGSKGIRVNAILPGIFPSEGTAHYSDNYKRRSIQMRVPAGRIGDPSDIAAASVFLASDASSYITGTSLPVDGGVLLF